MPLDQRSDFSQQRWLSCKNVDSEAAPPFAVMEVSGYNADEVGQFYLEVEKPSTTFQRVYAVNGPTRIQAGNFGQCTFDGPCFAKYDSGTPAHAEDWGMTADQWYLTSERPGFTVLGGANITTGSDKRTLVRPYEVNMLIGKTDAAHNKSTTGTVSIWFGADAGASDSTLNLTGVYNRYADVESGKFVTMEWINSGWELGAAEC